MVESPQLTDAEAAVFALLMQGQTNDEIAAQLVLSVRTVEAHLRNIRSRNGGTGKGDRWWLRLFRA